MDVSKQSLRRERTYSAILAATADLIGHERGMSVRIEEVCAKAGVSRGTFYNYFQNLGEVFSALTQDLNHAFNLAVLAAAAKRDSSAERSYFALYHFLDRASGDPAWGWVMLNLSPHGPFFGAETSGAALEAIQRGIDNGEFDIANAAFGRDMALGTCLAAIRSQLVDGRVQSLPQDAARYILRGLGVPEIRIAAIVAAPIEKLTFADHGSEYSWAAGGPPDASIAARP